MSRSWADESEAVGGSGLGPHGFVGFPEVGPPLGMADGAHGCADLGEHGCRDLTVECAELVPVDILCSNPHIDEG